MMQHNKLEILHLTKRFGEKTLFEDLNLTVEEPAVLWAPSGWGKTTPPARPHGAGNAYLRQCGVGQVSAVFQEDRLCPQLNAVQNVALVLPGLEIQYKEQIEICFQQLGLDSTALVLPARKLSGRPEAPGGSPAGAAGPQRHPAAGRAVHRDGSGDPAKSRRAHPGARRRQNVLLATHDRDAIAALGWPVIQLAE